MRALRYDLKLMYPLLQVVGFVGLWGLTVLVYVSTFSRGGLPASLRVYGVINLLETTLPLLALFAVGHALSLEWEERTIELSLSFIGGGADILTRRLTVGCLVILTMGGATLVTLWAVVPEMVAKPAGVVQLACRVIPPATFVAAVGLLGSVAGKQYLAGIISGLTVWGVNLVFPGKVARLLYLFQLSRPLPGLNLTHNRLALVAAALVALAATFTLWSNRERALR